MIYGYARESPYPNYPSLKLQGQSILNFCKNVLGEPLIPSNLYVDYHRPKQTVRIRDRHAAMALLRRAAKGDVIVAQAFHVLFCSTMDITSWADYLKNGQVGFYVCNKGKMMSEMNGKEVLECLSDARKATQRGWGGVILTKDGMIPPGQSRWVKVKGTGRDWVKVVESNGQVIPVLLKAQRLTGIVTLDEAKRMEECKKLLEQFERASNR